MNERSHTHPQSYSSLNKPDNTCIVHLFLLTPDGKILLIKGDRGLWSPISEKIELNESLIDTAFRGGKEELGLKIKNIFLTYNRSNGISPTGKMLQIHQCIGRLPKDFHISSLTPNDEVLDAALFLPLEALRILKQEGFKEGFNGLSHILRNGLGNPDYSCSDTFLKGGIRIHQSEQRGGESGYLGNKEVFAVLNLSSASECQISKKCQP